MKFTYQSSFSLLVFIEKILLEIFEMAVNAVRNFQ